MLSLGSEFLGHFLKCPKFGDNLSPNFRRRWHKISGLKIGNIGIQK